MSQDTLNERLRLHLNSLSRDLLIGHCFRKWHQSFCAHGQPTRACVCVCVCVMGPNLLQTVSGRSAATETKRFRLKVCEGCGERFSAG